MSEIYTHLFANQRFSPEEQFIKDNLLYEVVMGSQAYGVQTKDSDFDIVGVFMNRHQDLYPQQYGYILGFDEYKSFKTKECKHTNKIVRPDGKDIEGEWRALTYFFWLISEKGSPNLVETLFVRRALVKYSHEIFYKFRDNRKRFLSMKTFHAFKGYCFQQLSRLRNHKRTWDTEHKVENESRRCLYEKTGYDTKQAYHPLRLLDSIHQIITEGDLDLMRNKEECKAMRNGEWGDWKKFENYVDTRLKELENMATRITLAVPNRPQREVLHTFLDEAIEGYYGTHDKARKATEYVSAREVMDKLDKIEKKLDGFTESFVSDGK